MITVFGSINLDLIGGVDRLPGPGETVPGSAFATAPGGKGANQALAARRAGAPVRMIGAVGKDGFATSALALLSSGDVDLGGVRTVEEPTGVALILVDKAGENVIVVIPGANGAVGEADAATLAFSPGDVLLLQLEVPVAGIEAAARRARGAGAQVLLNFAPFRPEALDLVALATHLIVNETECALVAKALGIETGAIEELALAMARRLATTVIVTLGREGVVAAEAGKGEGTLAKAASLAVEAIDTVGAGDTFCGYLAAALSEGTGLDEALQVACAAGALACTRSGAQPSIPLSEDVETARRSGS